MNAVAFIVIDKYTHIDVSHWPKSYLSVNKIYFFYFYEYNNQINI